MSDEYYYHDEEPSYGLCNGCKWNDETHCMKYKMPLFMTHRKKKCKHFVDFNRCKCGWWMDVSGDEWICHKCGHPFFQTNSLEHRTFLMQRLMTLLFNQNSGFCQLRHHDKIFIRKVKNIQTWYLRGLNNEI